LRSQSTIVSAPKEDKPTAFKHWFDRKAAKALALQMKGALPEFDERAFVRRATQGLDELEFNDRVFQFSQALRATLPSSVPRALEVIVKSLPPALPSSEEVTDGYLQWPIGQFIADHGLEHFNESMVAMVELTQRLSSEFAVRPFVEQRPTETFKRLLALTNHKSAHVRRWCSEGTRPRLPWGKKLHALVADPSPIWPILEALKDDPERYVQRSVANNLNDIAKDHPEAVIKRCGQWLRGAPPGRRWIVHHALRTLIKAANPAALRLVGIEPPANIESRLRVSPRAIAIGESVTLELALTSMHEKPQELLIDYVVHYVRQRGKSGAKVFKWTKATLAPGETLKVQKRHAMRVTSIRALYPGMHRVEAQVNGVAVANGSFRLD
jgi:3-methyladenine DNA glycosylase AlkC